MAQPTIKLANDHTATRLPDARKKIFHLVTLSRENTSCSSRRKTCPRFRQSRYRVCEKRESEEEEEEGRKEWVRYKNAGTHTKAGSTYLDRSPTPSWRYRRVTSHAEQLLL